MARIVAAAQELHLELAPIGNARCGPDGGGVEKVRRGNAGVPAVHPPEQRHGLRAVVRCRNGELIRLNRPIEWRVISKRHLPLLRRPGRLAVLELAGALDAAIEHGQYVPDVGLARDVLRKIEHPVRGLGVHIDVRHQVVFAAFGLQRLDQGVELVDLRLNLLTIVRSQHVRRAAATACAARGAGSRSRLRR